MFRRFLNTVILLNFIIATIMPNPALAQGLSLPVPGAFLDASPAYAPLLITGLSVKPDNPMLFDFIVDTGDSGLKAVINDAAIREESQKLIKYFLASLTLPEKDQWVNLSPFEQERIMPESLDKTAMGRDMLAEDYMLKQVTASFLHPDKDLGKAFWAKVYAQSQEKFSTTDIPVDTFNKVWVSADKADVYVHDNTAFITDAHLKVMLEDDYLAQSAATSNVPPPTRGHDSLQAGSSQGIVSPSTLPTNSGLMTEATEGNHLLPHQELAKEVLRGIIIPALEHEVNQGKNFANLRQIFHSMILATWYKKNLKEALLTQVYANQAKTNGVEIARWETDPQAIYAQYVEAYKKGVVNLIKEETDPATGETMPRKYFSGGMADLAMANVLPVLPTDYTMSGNTLRVTTILKKSQDPAMNTITLSKEERKELLTFIASGGFDNSPAIFRLTASRGWPATITEADLEILEGRSEISDRLHQYRQPYFPRWTNGRLVEPSLMPVFIIPDKGRTLPLHLALRQVTVHSRLYVIRNGDALILVPHSTGDDAAMTSSDAAQTDQAQRSDNPALKAVQGLGLPAWGPGTGAAGVTAGQKDGEAELWQGTVTDIRQNGNHFLVRLTGHTGGPIEGRVYKTGAPFPYGQTTSVDEVTKHPLMLRLRALLSAPEPFIHVRKGTAHVIVLADGFIFSLAESAAPEEIFIEDAFTSASRTHQDIRDIPTVKGFLSRAAAYRNEQNALNAIRLLGIPRWAAGTRSDKRPLQPGRILGGGITLWQGNRTDLLKQSGRLSVKDGVSIGLVRRLEALQVTPLEPFILARADDRFFVVFSDGSIYPFVNIELVTGGIQDIGPADLGIADQILAAEPVRSFLEKTDKLKESRIDGNTAVTDLAMPPGGIDLNAQRMQMSESGQEVDMNFDPARIEQFRRGDFTGLVPVILNIAPIANLRPLLGLGPDDMDGKNTTVSFERKAVIRRDEAEA
jgi:virulence-associated protein VagC